MSETKKTHCLILKITYDSETLKIENIQEIPQEQEEREYLALTPETIDERLVNALTTEDMEELNECYDFLEN